jgi:hypothetical protein
MDEMCIEKDTSSAKSMKDARNELARQLTQQNIYFVRELTSKVNPYQPFPSLKIKACYYLSRNGPIVETSISLHAWCRLCVALDSDPKNYDSDVSIKQIATEYATVSTIQIMSQLPLLATFLLAENKIIRPSQFDIVSLPQEQQEASNEITQRVRVVSPQEPEETILSTETPLSQIPQVQSKCSGLSSQMLYSILETNPGMIVKRFSIVAGVIRHTNCAIHLAEDEMRTSQRRRNQNQRIIQRPKQ